MLMKGLEQFAGKRVLLLQGPMGPFFWRLRNDLTEAGARVFKVNFNAGDWFFYPRDAINYRGSMEDWPDSFERLIERLGIDIVLLYGDCRPMHRAAHSIAIQYGLKIGVFEEGYVRPDYITLERFGVNGYSLLPQSPEFYHWEAPRIPEEQDVGNSFWRWMAFTILYDLMGALGKPWFRRYQHHRPFTLLEGLPWIRSAWRKAKYLWLERGVQEQLTGEWRQRYFLVPLQVFNDTQITVHADSGVAQFIENTLLSFARHAPAGTLLVFKHHPMDRGYCDYADLIRRVAERVGVTARVRYIHDQHLPTLLRHTRGVVLVNSTVGLSALFHGAPTKVCGNAFYNIPGLVYQGALDDFWEAAPKAKPDRKLFKKFRAHLIARTQINGSYYRKLKQSGTHSGLIWGNRTPVVEQPNLQTLEFE